MKKSVLAILAVSIIAVAACGKENIKEIPTTTTKEMQQVSTELVTTIEESTTIKQDDLSNMAEFQAPDGSYSIYLPKDWQQEDMGIDYWIMTGEKNGDSAAVVMKCPKSGAAYRNMEEFQSYIRTSYSIKNEKIEETAPIVEGMISSVSEDYEVELDGIKGAGYNIYIEFEDNYFAIVFLGEEKSISKYKEMVKKGSEMLTQKEIERIDASVSPTLRWIMATYAPLTIQNGGNINLFGSSEKTEIWSLAATQSLESSWGITDRESLDKTVERLMTGKMHNPAVLEDYKTLELANFQDREALLSWCLEEGKTEGQTNAISAAYDAVNQYGDNAILAWDLVRAMSVIGYAYIADYYTYEEAWALSIETAKSLQRVYTSWDDMMQSYWYGYQYWAEENPEDSSSVLYNRKKIYEELKQEQDSPYNLDWNMELE